MNSPHMIGLIVGCAVVVACSSDKQSTGEVGATGGAAGHQEEGGSAGQPDDEGTGLAGGSGATAGSCEGESTQDCACGVQTRTCKDGTWSEWSVCASVCGPLETCHDDSLCVAKMVSIDDQYWIDATEVTNSQYQAWLGTNPGIGGQDSYCGNNTDFTPGCDWAPETQGDNPVGCVDWCDAKTYCARIGKRLCGRIGGGAVPFDMFADASLSQWHNACSAGGQNDYSYGNEVNEQACNGPAAGRSSPVDVGALPMCSSPVVGYTGVYDLSGNVWEWEDSCGGPAIPAEYCNSRGGSYYSGSLRCDDAVAFGRGDQAPNLGFRCCADNAAP
jgi:hypothetical protein